MKSASLTGNCFYRVKCLCGRAGDTGSAGMMVGAMASDAGLAAFPGLLLGFTCRHLYEQGEFLAQ
jgi:hypothetical protein